MSLFELIKIGIHEAIDYERGVLDSDIKHEFIDEAFSTKDVITIRVYEEKDRI